MENFDKKENLNVESTDFNLVRFEHDSIVDRLVVDEKELKNIKNFIEKNPNIDEINKSYFESAIDSIKLQILDINNKLDDIIDFGIRDFSGDIDMEENESKAYLSEIANSINKSVNDFLKDIQNEEVAFSNDFKNIYDRISELSDRYINVRKVEDFVLKLEKKKQEKSRDTFLKSVATFFVGEETMKNIEKHKSAVEGRKINF